MYNKRGQIFALYIVMLTLFLCVVVVAMYVIQQENVQSSLVSPRMVLDIRNDLEVLEFSEIELIKKSCVGAEGEFGSSAFIDSFRDSFLEGVILDGNIENFLSDFLYVGGVEVRMQDVDKSLFEDIIYPKSLTSFEGDIIIFERAMIEKRVELDPVDSTKISFPVDLSFKFGKKYLIKKINDKCEVTSA
jgi:hypothetical protein